MRALMGLIKDRHGTYYAQRKVPERLQEAVARVLNSVRDRQVFLKKSLGTKVLKQANIAATHVLADFDRTIAAAEALLKEAPVLPALTDAQIKRMAETYYAGRLADDEEQRREGTGSEPLFQSIAKQLSGAGIEYQTPFAVGNLPEAGLSDREITKRAQLLDYERSVIPQALARGDITVIREELDELLYAFQLNTLDRKSSSYRKLGMAVLAAYVRVLKDIERRDAGEAIDTPASAYVSLTAHGAPEGGGLRDALEGWKKERERPADTVHEYSRAIEMFIALHGNLTLSNIKRKHARTFRECLQMVPKVRRGTLLNAGLPELSQWGREHPSAPKVSSGTVNKQIGAVQAIAGWGYRNGIVPDDVQWSDPFKDLRLDEERSARAPFDVKDLQTIFNVPLFTDHEIPDAGKGAAAVWLPLLALFAGGRQAEFAGLRASDVRDDPDNAGVPLLWIVSDKKARRTVKTPTSERVVPVHPALRKLGFLKYVATRRAESEKAWLFPSVAPDQKGGLKAWSKWWGRYLRTQVGIKDTDKVFHSFRHGFTDRARAGGVDEEARKALMGHSDAHTVSGGYGAKTMLARWSVKRLKAAVDKISYPGLDLSRVQTLGSAKRTRGIPSKRKAN